ncbi:ABC transporter permease [Actinomadura atramentaria]|uniref:ABC transporter permease n=1 Tax=Actinomadura atramentaria TaxID=1990 RepID=UPI000374F2AE|nr:ABC transporter permease [Actinomadura atramentaria]
MARRGRFAPYLLVLPGGLWLLAFFLIPMTLMASLSLQSGNLIDGFRQTFHWQNYRDGIGVYGGVLARSLGYALAATVACAVLSYPAAHWIAFRAGRHKTRYLFLLVVPYFVSFVLRTFAWRQVLTDDGPLLGPLKDHGLLPTDFRVLDTGFAVIAGLTYNFLPFMALPIYVALERVDRSLPEAARDLYAGRAAAFARVLLPLSLPGVFAGAVLTFVPMAADYVNAEVLGGPDDTMVGGVVRAEYFDNGAYPTASALSFTLMAVLLVAVLAYARALGARNVLGDAA